ncbi:hypothetical protein MASR2M78_32240 [Treponema sp.]
MDRTEGYRVLGLGKRFDGKELKTAYRYLSKKYHPDRSSVPGTNTRFVRLNSAYETLQNELEKKDVHDAAELVDQDADLFALGAIALRAGQSERKKVAIRRLGFSGKKAAYLFLRRVLTDYDEEVVAVAVRSIADLSAYQAAGEISALYLRASYRLRNAILDAAEATGEALFEESLHYALKEGGIQSLRARQILDTYYSKRA